ncbi:MAG: NifB/NifX family molybdenum-iron cluster-binding protein [Chloroflexota bacterium]
MKVVVTADGNSLDAPFVPVFGRCPTFLLVDADTLACEAMENSAAFAAGGAGIQAAQMVADKGAQAVITGAVGPNAYQVLAAANVPVLIFNGRTVREAVQAYQLGQLQPVGAATAPAHAGMGRMGQGGGRGQGRGMGQGRGQGMGPGRGMGGR